MAAPSVASPEPFCDGPGLCMEIINHWISLYGYFGIFSLLVLGIVGLPIPDETLLAFAGFLVFKRELHPIPTFFAAFLGSACGITISYILGRSLGLLVLHRFAHVFHITSERVDRVHEWFSRVGTWGLLFGYFIPGVRHLTAIAAGTSRLRPIRFALFAYAGAAAWVATFISVGYVFGNEWKPVKDRIESHLGSAALLAFVLVIVSVVVRYRSQWGRRH